MFCGPIIAHGGWATSGTWREDPQDRAEYTASAQRTVSAAPPATLSSSHASRSSIANLNGVLVSGHALRRRWWAQRRGLPAAAAMGGRRGGGDARAGAWRPGDAGVPCAKTVAASGSGDARGGQGHGRPSRRDVVAAVTSQCSRRRRGRGQAQKSSPLPAPPRRWSSPPPGRPPGRVSPHRYRPPPPPSTPWRAWRSRHHLGRRKCCLGRHRDYCSESGDAVELRL